MPKYFVVVEVGTCSPFMTPWFRGSNSFGVRSGSYDTKCTVSNATSVFMWYHSSNAEYQFNYSDKTYGYIALA